MKHFVLFACVAVGLIFAGCRNRQEPPVPVVVQEAEPKDTAVLEFPHPKEKLNNFFASRANRKNWYKPCNFAPKMDESGDFWRSVTTEMAVRHNKHKPAPPAAFQSVLAVAAAAMQRGTPQKKKSLTGKSGKAQPVPPTGIPGSFFSSR